MLPSFFTAANAAADPVVVKSADFEDGTTQGFTRRGTVETVANSTTVAHAGSRSLAVSARASSWQGPQLDVLSTMQKGVRYTISVWVRQASGAGTAPYGLSVERRLTGTTTAYDNIVRNVSVSDSGWTQLTGSYTLGNDVDFLTVYVESQSGTFDFFIDDFSMSYVPAQPVQTNVGSLKGALAPYWSQVGAAVSPSTILAGKADLLKIHYNSLVAGNAMKWDATEKTEGVFSYGDADTIVNFATANNMKVRGHTFVWHNQTPAWVFQDANGATMTATAANKTLLLNRLKAHIDALAGRYKGKISAWDVVNEVLNEDGTPRNSMWYQIAGLDYIRNAFTWARAADPGAVLCINDYNLTVGSKRDGMYNLVNQLKGEGIPIDCVGSQMHNNINWPTASDTSAMLDKFAALNVTQQITEMDVSIYTDNTSSYTTVTDAHQTALATRYKALFDVFKAKASLISSVTFWGVSDDDSWLQTWPIARLDAPLLFDSQLQVKPAYWAVTGLNPSGTVTTAVATTTRPPTSAVPTSAVATTRPPTSAVATTGSTGPCRVTYAVAGQWPSGFQGDVKVTNTGTTAINNWTLTWTFANGQTISQLWNGSVTQSGANVSVAGAAWNSSIAVNATVNVGFLASWNDATNARPTAFSLNGTACTVA
ncbi:endo-1,4-beta-xylanase [Luedemannella flava]